MKAGDEGKISYLRKLTLFPTTPSKQIVTDVTPSEIYMFSYLLIQDLNKLTKTFQIVHISENIQRTNHTLKGFA